MIQDISELTPEESERAFWYECIISNSIAIGCWGIEPEIVAMWADGVERGLRYAWFQNQTRDSGMTPQVSRKTLQLWEQYIESLAQS